MDRDQIIERLYKRYIEPTKNKNGKYIGVEIEMPIVNLNGEAVDFEIVHGLTKKFIEQFQFTPSGIDDSGEIYSACSEKNGDILSYDCSYNNLELSFGKASILHEINERFLSYYTYIQDYFKQYNYTLTGMGVNPNRLVNHNIPIENGRYRMLFHHLHGAQKYSKLPMYFHKFPEYGTFSSASQVQLDADFEKLPEILNTFSKLEPIKALIFSNSVMPDEDADLLCCRDMFWENSPHGINPHNVGMYECEFTSIDDILNYIASTSIYCTERDGKYINFTPINIVEYFSRSSIDGEYFDGEKYKEITFAPDINDINYLRTFKFEDLTFRGTIEFRSVCCQPIDSAMSTAAFHIGLMDKIDELNDLLENDNVIYHKGYTAGELRKLLIRRSIPEFIDEDKLYLLAQRVLEISRNGLSDRGFGEEKYLKPLFERVKKRTNPAKEMLLQLENGLDINAVTLDCSKPSND